MAVTITQALDPHHVVTADQPRAVVQDPERPNVLVFEPDPWTVGLTTVGAGLGAYHGYKRTNSLGWALGWAALGALFPVVTTAVALAQGFGKKE